MRFKTLKDLASVLISPPVDPQEQSRRIGFMEENVVLPVKGILIAMVFYFLFFSGEFEGVKTLGEGGFQLTSIRLVLVSYLLFNCFAAYVLVRHRHYPSHLVQLVVFSNNLMDALIVALCTMLTGGLNTFAYWVFLALIIRNAVSVPSAPWQISLNLLLVICYVAAAIIDKTSITFEIERQFELEETQLRAAHLIGGNTYQPYIIRVFLMLLLIACCYGVQILFDRQRQVEEDLREHLLRQEQLQSAGRVAAEIAHQIKNPLAIITNASFSLQKSMAAEGKKSALQQIQIIRDEVERADRIITELMGYAQLAEGKVEKLNVIEELNRAVDSVFPKGTHEKIKVVKDFDYDLLSLQMQQRHLSEVFVNLLTNAREALNGEGRIKIMARNAKDYTVLITFEDSGPGIPPEKIVKIFEAYFTTKEKGSGLGLAIARQNVEIYGGTLTVESEIGHGAKFILNLPARTMMRINR
ncbi:MAG: BaeS [Verrucomicrobia bacterium]|jgi:signal transduction histidine kinase|nr:BaeS [Verrucomicrobiota bacterium]